MLKIIVQIDLILGLWLYSHVNFLEIYLGRKNNLAFGFQDLGSLVLPEASARREYCFIAFLALTSNCSGHFCQIGYFT